MSSCTECHGMAGKEYDDHVSSECPRLATTSTDKDPGREQSPYDDINKLIQAWMYDKKAQVGPKRTLIGNNFDMLARKIAEYVVTNYISASQATAAQDRMLEALAYPVKCLKEIDRVCTEELANFSSLHQGKDKEST